MIRAGLLSGWIALVGLSGCGSVVTEGSGSTSGSGGTGSGAGGHGAGGQGAGGQGSGAGGGICGGLAGLPCPPDAFCLFDDPGTCGNADGSGHCMPRPDGCPKNCVNPLLCGCDGAMYCNDCLAHAAGTDVSSSGSCNGKPNEQYSASPMFTNVPRFAVFKVDFQRGICVRFLVEDIGGGTTVGISAPSGWSVSGAEITNAIDDCALVNGYLAPPIAGHVSADGGSGAITFTSSGAPPSEVTLHAALTFPAGGPAWVPASEPLDADNLPVQ